jgi:hypothetical protein
MNNGDKLGDILITRRGVVRGYTTLDEGVAEGPVEFGRTLLIPIR